jgi:hypothetical protein
MKAKTLFASACAVMALAGSASAHHAFNMYQNDRYVALKGTVKSWVWKNPHAMIEFVAVDPDGKMDTWSVECSSPNIIGRKGWSMDSIRVGDKLDLTLHPMKDGSKYGLMVSVITPRGETLKDKD